MTVVRTDDGTYYYGRRTLADVVTGRFTKIGTYYYGRRTLAKRAYAKLLVRLRARLLASSDEGQPWHTTKSELFREPQQHSGKRKFKNVEITADL